MTTSYFSFGQSHVHSCGGVTLDKDTILKITADDPREVMFDLFGDKWAFEYEILPPDMSHFPGGIVELNKISDPSCGGSDVNTNKTN